MANRLLYLSYYFEPDLSAGSFRNASLSAELSSIVNPTTEIHLVCSMPNRYGSIQLRAPEFEKRDNLYIYRIPVTNHGNNFIKQIFSFWQYRRGVLQIAKTVSFDAIFASSSKLFTAHLAFQLSQKKNIPYYLDIRDLFADNVRELIPIFPLNALISTFLKNFIQQPTFSNARHINVNSKGYISILNISPQQTFSFYPNGIDDIFLQLQNAAAPRNEKPIILYAGNIGSGQGLDKLIPKAAKALEDKYDWLIIGDGSTKSALSASLKRNRVKNVRLLPPVVRNQLVDIYQKVDILLIHLNNFRAFEKVIPSKLFEYGATNRFIVAGVAGYASDFIKEEIKDHYFIFKPCDAEALIQFLRGFKVSFKPRPEFVENFNRKKITNEMAASIKRVLDL